MAKEARQFTDDEVHVVRVLLGHGIPLRIIGQCLECHESQISRRFQPEIQEARKYCEAQVVQTLFRMATSGRVPAATFFWLKTQCGWREVQEVTLNHKNFTELGDDELIERAAAVIAGNESTSPEIG